VAQVRVPRVLSQIVKRAMAREPVNRYASVAEMRDELVAFMRGGGSFPTILLEPGQHVVVEGEEADAAYIVVSGRVHVYAKRSGRHETLADLGPGDVFGETAILAATTRTASVVAVTEARLRVIERDVFEQELDDMVPWMGRFIRALAKRFRESLSTSTTTTSLRRVQPLHLVNTALMFILTWGKEDQGTHAASWRLLCGHVKEQHAVNERALAMGLSTYDAFEVDPAADRVSVSDIAALKERLAKPLGLAPKDSTAEAPGTSEL
jgi:serine/threonine-protein kinase